MSFFLNLATRKLYSCLVFSPNREQRRIYYLNKQGVPSKNFQSYRNYREVTAWSVTQVSSTMLENSSLWPTGLIYMSDFSVEQEFWITSLHHFVKVWMPTTFMFYLSNLDVFRWCIQQLRKDKFLSLFLALPHLKQILYGFWHLYLLRSRLMLSAEYGFHCHENFMLLD